MDINAIRAKLSSLNNKSNRQDNLWKPEEGKNTVRIVPYQHQKDYPFIEMYFHYGIAPKRTLVSPITSGQADPIVEFADKLKSSGEKADWEMAKGFYPNMRTYVPVIVRGKESEGVKFWGFGKTVYQELLAIIADEDYGDITDPTTGRDITVEFTKGNVPTDNKTSIRVKPNTSVISDETAVIQKVTNQLNFNEIYKENTYEELKAALFTYLNPSDEVETTPQNSSSNTNDTDTPKSAPKAPSIVSSTKVDDVSGAFDALFN